MRGKVRVLPVSTAATTIVGVRWIIALGVRRMPTSRARRMIDRAGRN